MSHPTIGVLALQGDVREHLRRIDVCGAIGMAVRTARDLDRVDGLILPGGESTTIAKLLHRFDVMSPLRDKLRDGLPIYGSCAGMILLAERILDAAPHQDTIGGMDVTVRRNAFGRQVESFEIEVPMPEVGEAPFSAVFIRAPWVEQSGPGVQVLGRVRGGVADGRVVAVRQGALLATSFHPELTDDGRIHQYFVDMVRANTLRLRQGRDTVQCAMQVGREQRS